MYQQILYTSRAVDGLTFSDVYDIIRTAHNRNSRSGLTGGLLFLDGHFYQVLEGSSYAVHERYKAISADARHHDLMLRRDIATSELAFPSEWMALKDGTSIAPAILRSHDYQPGMPEEKFTDLQVLAFVLDCFTTDENAPQ
ncbi:MAG: BLUF domain-containing protein [Planctomycetales bacterium]|nr:BLUF domain-containing protein [Planctomycetales bacterium]